MNLNQFGVKPRKSTLFFLIVIAILITVIVLIYFNSTTNINKNTQSMVKSAETENMDIKLPAVDFDKITIPPQKNTNNSVNIQAYNYILIDADSFYPLLEKNSDKLVPIASTTKILTAIIVLENYNLLDIVTISKNAANQIGDDVALRTNEKITVESLLYILLLKSGNDAAMALAEFYPDGGKDGFMLMVNQKAQYLGMKNTKLFDPAGLDDNGKSTAFDLAVATSYAMKNKKFYELVNTSERTVTSADSKLAHELKSSNRLILPDENLYFSFANGVKTGFTPDAGHCLVSSATKDDHQLIGVILNTYENSITASAKESKKLLEFGFNNFNWQ